MAENIIIVGGVALGSKAACRVKRLHPAANVVIIVGPFSEEGARYYFEEVDLAGIHDCEWCMPWRDGIPIWLARKPRMLWSDAWPELKHYE